MRETLDKKLEIEAKSLRNLICKNVLAEEMFRGWTDAAWTTVFL